MTGTFAITCECGKAQCLDQLNVTAETYEHARSDSRLFLVRPGHELPDTETVLERAATYFLVQKDPGLPAAIANATDPRS